MSDPSPPSTTEPSAIEIVLDRPVRQTVNFLAQSSWLWCQGFIDPWGLGKKIATKPSQLVPPYAFLVASFFLTGIFMRLWIAMDAISHTTGKSVVQDLNLAMNDISLGRVIMVTLPCVIIVVAGGKILSCLYGKREASLGNHIVSAACYATGWQALLVAVMALFMVMLQISGFEPSGMHHNEVDLVLLILAILGLVWGILILLPSLRENYKLKRWWVLPGQLSSCTAITIGVLACSLWVLGASVDLYGARQIREQRRLNDVFGELHAVPLQVQPIAASSQNPQTTLKVTVAYTSHSKHLLVIPRKQSLLPSTIAKPKNRLVGFDIVESSLDDLPDRALLIYPGESRIAEFILQPQSDASSAMVKDLQSLPINTPYGISYHRREPDGGFLQGEASLYVPVRAIAATVNLKTPATLLR